MKPEELGYTQDITYKRRYSKYKDGYEFCIVFYEQQNKYFGRIWCSHSYFYNQEHIDKLQIAFNNLKRDLKELNNGQNN